MAEEQRGETGGGRGPVQITKGILCGVKRSRFYPPNVREPVEVSDMVKFELKKNPSDSDNVELGTGAGRRGRVVRKLQWARQEII